MKGRSEVWRRSSVGPCVQTSVQAVGRQQSRQARGMRAMALRTTKVVSFVTRSAGIAADSTCGIPVVVIITCIGAARSATVVPSAVSRCSRTTATQPRFPRDWVAS